MTMTIMRYGSITGNINYTKDMVCSHTLIWSETNNFLLHAMTELCNSLHHTLSDCMSADVNLLIFVGTCVFSPHIENSVYLPDEFCGIRYGQKIMKQIKQTIGS